MDIAATLAEIKSLSITERLALVEAIWDSIAAESENLPLTDAQRQNWSAVLRTILLTRTTLYPGRSSTLRRWQGLAVDVVSRSPAGSP